MAQRPSSARPDLYSRITQEIAAAIEAGAGTWRMPWHHDGATSARPVNVLGRRYHGVNVLALWAAARKAGFGSGVWATYTQWAAAGAQVRRGERATIVVLWKSLPSRSEDEREENAAGRPRMFARAFPVFNRAQVAGYDAAGESPTYEAIDALGFFERLEIPITYGAFDAHYRIAEDRIYMPPPAAFADTAGFIGTLAHECAHGTGALHRLNRNFAERFGPEARAIEEITAELTAGFLLADLGLAHRPRPDHAAYIASWLRVLNDDPRAIFTAASQAQQAADWMHARQPAPRPNGG